jgi:antitoxin component of MazEF toxin-antitoxin module
MKEYKVEEIFQDDPNDPENVIMTIPPEIMEAKGWKEGTAIKVYIGDKGSLIIEEIKEKETDGEE